MTPARLADKCAAHTDAGALSTETPRFVVIDRTEWPQFELRQIADGVFTLATVPAVATEEG